MLTLTLVIGSIQTTLCSEPTDGELDAADAMHDALLGMVFARGYSRDLMPEWPLNQSCLDAEPATLRCARVAA